MAEEQTREGMAVEGLPVLAEEQLAQFVQAIEQGARDRLRALGKRHADEPAYFAGAMAAMAACGWWEQVPMLWHIAIMRGVSVVAERDRLNKSADKASQ